MKKITLGLVGAIAMAAPAFAYDYSQDDVKEEAAEVRASERAVQKDNADINRYHRYLEENRAEKARAKSEGNYGRQALESAQIGANKAAIQAKKAERAIDRKILEKDREDLREARGEYRDYDRARDSRDYSYRDYYGSMSPSSGARAPYNDRFPSPFPQGVENRPAGFFNYQDKLDQQAMNYR